MTLNYNFDGCDFDFEVDDRECVESIVSGLLRRESVSDKSINDLVELIYDNTNFVEAGLDDYKLFLSEMYDDAANESFRELKEIRTEQSWRD